MKLDASALRYLTKEDFRILSALEIGSKNHEVVPLQMIASICRLRPGAVNGRLSELSRLKLVSKEHNASYEGFRLTYGGYDYLALHALSLRGSVEGVGRQIGVGKESDIYLVSGRYPTIIADESNVAHDKDLQAYEEEFDGPLESLVLKIERLGRTSFRTVKTNRDYVGKRKHVSWMYLSRLAAEKEWAFLNALHRHGLPTPKPADWNRHCIVMEHVKGRQLEQVHAEDYPEDINLSLLGQFLYEHLMRLVVQIADHGLIHGDFNEFNLMLSDEFIEDPQSGMEKGLNPMIIIDFPQMVSTSHRNAKEFFDRDVNCLRIFFKRRYGFEAAEWPDFENDISVGVEKSLDAELRASGFRGISDVEDSSSDDEEEIAGSDDANSDGEDASDDEEEVDSDDEEINSKDEDTVSNNDSDLEEK